MRCRECGADHPDTHVFCNRCGHPLERCDDSFAARDVIAALATSQDQVTWLAFSLAMTIEALLGIAYVSQIGIEHGRLFISLAGAFLGFVFFLLVMRSTYDMGILYDKGKKAFPYAFHLPSDKRFGIRSEKKSLPSAGDVMEATLVVWIGVWIAAFFYGLATSALG